MKFFYLIFLLFLLSACSNFDDENYVKIGFIAPLSTEATSYGISMKDIINYSVMEINEYNGFNGKKAVPLPVDGKCSKIHSKLAMEELISQGIKIVIGGVCSDEVLGAVDLAKENDVLMFSPSASSHLISEHDNVFRNTVSNEYYAYVLAEKAFESGFRKTAIITEFSEYTESLKSQFIYRFEELGGEVVYFNSFDTFEDDISYLHDEVENLDIDFLTLFFQNEISIKHFFFFLF